MKEHKGKLASLNILVVEDDKFQRLAIIQILKRIGVKSIEPAEDGQQAIAKIKHQTFDIILCDLSMPNMDGLALIRQLGDNNFSGSIIMCSAMDESLLRSSSSMAKGWNINVLGAMSKPVEPVKLLKNLLKHFDVKQKRSEQNFTFELNHQDLDTAFIHQQILPYFQAQVCLKTGDLLGYEALVRWQHPTYGLIAPDNFIPLAEQTNQIIELTEVVFRLSLEQLNSLPETLSAVKLAINISPKNLDNNVVQSMLLSLDKKLNNKKQVITIEVTEQSAIKCMSSALEVLSRFRMHGFNISMDDFGTGYSTMEQISQLPFNELKIDRAFVSKMDTDASALIIVESCIRLAKKLKLKTIAEGVENSLQWHLLERLGCDYCQGYFISKPEPIELLPLAIDSWNRNYQIMLDKRPSNTNAVEQLSVC
jgi:EAL domain-containing protein (putative c-di-GMP-specific phosphodiesterase class I)/FixJ family two-component response regulator